MKSKKMHVYQSPYKSDRIFFCRLISRFSYIYDEFYRFFRNDDENEAIAAIHHALKSGVNYIDTAPYYGQGRSERIIGKALKDVPRKAYYIATKVCRYDLGGYDNQFDFTAKRTKESIETSLKLLGLDYVDIVQIHDVEFAPSLDMVVNETLPAVEEAKKQEKLKYIGFSGYPLNALKQTILKAPGRFDVSSNFLFVSPIINTFVAINMFYQHLILPFFYLKFLSDCFIVCPIHYDG